MKAWFLALLFCFALCVPEIYPESGHVPGEIIVGLRCGAGPAALGKLGLRFGARQSMRIDELNAVILRLENAEDIETAISEYAGHADVLYAEPNYIARALGIIPDDPYFDLQWHLPRIGMPSVWLHQRGSGEIIVSVVDSGVESSHPELASRLVPGYNFVYGTPDTDDDNGHGTFIAGIIGAETNNGEGIAGINWDVSIMPVKSLDRFGAGSYADVAAGIVFSADNGARVINLSLGGKNPSLLLEEAVNHANRLGCVVVAAAGNDGGGQILYPAAYRHVIAVGASNEHDARCDAGDWGPRRGSNYGPEIDLVAPGDKIISTHINGGYSSGSGTSAASAVVSGAAAILLSAEDGLFPGEVRWLMNFTADTQPDGWNEFTGHGRLNVYEALLESGAVPRPGPPARWPFFKTPGNMLRWISSPARR